MSVVHDEHKYDNVSHVACSHALCVYTIFVSAFDQIREKTTKTCL